MLVQSPQSFGDATYLRKKNCVVKQNKAQAFFEARTIIIKKQTNAKQKVKIQKETRNTGNSRKTLKQPHRDKVRHSKEHRGKKGET